MVRRRNTRGKNAMKGSTLAAPRRLTKEEDFRLLGVTDRLSAWLEEYVPLEARINPTLPLFVNQSGRGPDGRYSHFTLADIRRAACRKADVKVALYEGTKHSTATWLRKHGFKLDEIAAALGHSAGRDRDERTTERYARPVSIMNREIRDALNQRDQR